MIADQPVERREEATDDSMGNAQRSDSDSTNAACCTGMGRKLSFWFDDAVRSLLLGTRMKAEDPTRSLTLASTLRIAAPLSLCGNRAAARQ